ncbi:MAG TPA: restriction endonuclease subunit S [Candidatus Moranbacteria bacterium]|nr:restriction endonuclease subunit S [Candidatus Moranbacteria bacterium]
MVWNDELDQEIPKGWEVGTLKDILTLFSGYSFKGEEYSFDEGITVVRGENVTEQGFRWDTHKKWNNKLPGRSKDCFLKPYDIIVGMDGSKVGKNWGIVSKFQLPLLLAQRISCLRSIDNYFQTYAYYSFFEQRFENYVHQVHTGTSVPHISGDQILDFSIIKPNHAITKYFNKIALKIIDKSHQVIEENQKLNDLLSIFLSKMTKAEATA